MNLRFDNKIAIVTGGAGGIGAAICQVLARGAATVVVCDLNKEGAIEVASGLEAQGLKALPLETDIADGEACRRMVADIINRYGRIDLLSNNAGINRRGDLLSLTEQDWNLSFDVNIHSMFHLCRAVLPHMIKAGGGAIVNTASQWGLHPAPGHIAYNVTKAAVASFTQNLARDYAPHQIRVNAVRPGEIHTPMLEQGVKNAGKSIADLDALVPYGRIGRPDEVAALVAFLMSDEASFMCGSLVEITGAQAVS